MNHNRGWEFEEMGLRAAALTYYSIMAIVPALAVAFGIAQMIGFGDTLDQLLLDKFAEQQDVIEHAMGFAKNMLERTRGSIIALAGGVLFLWAVICLLWNIEEAFNQILHVEKSRNFFRRIVVYLLVILFSPICLALTNNVAIFALTYSWLVRAIPVVVSILLFTFLYIVMPNARISFRKGLFAGTITGIGFQAMQWIYWQFQIGVATYGVIYGSFAAIPLFLIWINASWMVILLGGKMAYKTIHYIKGMSHD